jgi:hypothetical protein
MKNSETIKMKFLNISLLFILLLVTNIEAQVYRSPAYVRFIANGYINQTPYFNTLEQALNNVKSTADVSSPFVFWVAGDTIRIPDWDSVFTESGLTMKDSIDIYYVATGKIKWAGFGFGGTGGTGGASIIQQDATTLHYDWASWDQDNIALPLWQRLEGQKADSIDEEVWRLIVYTKLPLYIENDTLKIDTTGFGGGSAPLSIDTLTFLRTTGDQIFTGTKTNGGTLRNSGTVDFSGSGNIQLPSINGATGQPRRIWGSNDNIFYSGAGAIGDTTSVAMVDTDTDELRDQVVGWNALTTALQIIIDNKAVAEPPYAFLNETAYTPDVTTAGEYVKIAPTFNLVESNNITVAGDTITILASYTGSFIIQVEFTLQNAATDDFTLQIRLNNVTARSIRFTGAGASEYITVSAMHHFNDLVAGDDISFYITNVIDTDDPVMTGINVYVHRIHP